MLEKLFLRSLPAVAAAALLATITEAATIEIETVPVGNPGNANDTHGAGYGSVDYRYEIGKYEVTTGEYTEFLNAVAATDPYGLYSTRMSSSEQVCRIERSGSPGSYSYSVARDRKDRPVNYVSWGDAARFANWLHNGQPTGAQDLSTTEDGAYYLNGATSATALTAVTRQSDAIWFIPTEDEWYKAAYYDGVAEVYYDFATGTNDKPSDVLIDPDPGNNANYNGANGYTIGSPYWMTITGAFENSESPYGTFDQNGNVSEWTETAYGAETRVLRGGSWDLSYHPLAAFERSATSADYDPIRSGFRVATIPEPDSITLLVCGLIAGLICWRRRK